MQFWMGVFTVIGVECLVALVWFLAPLGHPAADSLANACQAQRTRIDKTR